MNYPTHLQYSKSHEWIHTEDGVAVIGIFRLCPARSGRRGVCEPARRGR